MTGSFAALKVDGTVEAAEYVNSKVRAWVNIHKCNTIFLRKLPSQAMPSRALLQVSFSFFFFSCFV
jgi:hypothetical protein